MSDLNKVIIQGRLTRDVEVRYTAGGMAVGNFGLASNRRYKDKEEVCFLDCTAFGKTAEIMAEYVKKGGQALVEGRLKTESWEDKQSHQKKSKMVLIVDNFYFTGGGKIEPTTTAKAEPTTEGEKPLDDGEDSGVPF